MKYEKCCFCDKPFVKPDFGCNPYPIMTKGRCCSWCDNVLVTMVRLLPKVGLNEAQSITVRSFIRAMCISHREGEQMNQKWQKEMMRKAESK